MELGKIPHVMVSAARGGGVMCSFLHEEGRPVNSDRENIHLDYDGLLTGYQCAGMFMGT